MNRCSLGPQLSGAKNQWEAQRRAQADKDVAAAEADLRACREQGSLPTASLRGFSDDTRTKSLDTVPEM